MDFIADRPHNCRDLGSSIVCFERENELWVKEYSDRERPEGRTYKVNNCPFCGYFILEGE